MKRTLRIEGHAPKAAARLGRAILAVALCASLVSCLTGKKRPADGGTADDGCSETCVPGEGDCAGDYIRFCIKDPLGCPRWTTPQPCPPAQPFCSNGRCEAQCDDECSQKGLLRCMEHGHQICGQHDSDQCLDWGPVLACGEKELCWPSTGECLPDCDGTPCACEAGETEPCADVGTCEGGLRSCVDGFFSPCAWDVPPRAEICDGKDNDCDTQTDNHIELPESCEKQLGVCKGAAKRCGGAQGWLACNEADYSAHATTVGLTYEATETTCDGKDNDCNGETDEPPQCCKPDCTDAACGDDDGCGHKCLEGSCPTGQMCSSTEEQCVCAPDCTEKSCGDPDTCGGLCNGPCPNPNESCQAGQCACNYLKCGTTCCALKEVCKGDACCQPSCGARVCGPDPQCGSSCGACGAGEVCSSAGTCLKWAIAFQATTDLYAVSGIAGPSPVVWAVGAQGTVLHNAGAWQTMAATPSQDLHGLWGTAATDAWVVGVSGIVAHYDGSQWTTVAPAPTAVTLNGIFGFGEDLFAIGDSATVLRRATTLSSWEPQLVSGATANLRGIWGTAAADLWAVGDGGLLLHRTTAWAPTTLASGKNLRGIWGSSATDVWIVGDGGTILRRDSAGTGWSAAAGGHTADLLGIFGTSSSDVWVVGAQGKILHFDGVSWVEAATPTASTLRGVWAASSTAAWAVGDGGVILELATP